jgi:RimJ/RimL family protein N-acetyltransferase
VTSVLETARLRLPPWAPQDAALLSALSSNPRVTRYIGLGQTWTELKAAAVAERALAHWREHGFGWRSIIDRASREPVGLLALNRMGEGTAGVEPEEVEVGWWLDPARWGCGLATEAARAVLADAFATLRPPHVTARIRPDNQSSLAVADRLGMRFAFHSVAEPGIAVTIHRMWPSGVPAEANRGDTH